MTQINENKPLKIAAAIVVNNEKILKTLKTCENIISGLIVYCEDCEDCTFKLVQGWSNEQKIPLHVKKGKLTDFTESRNRLLDFTDEFPEYTFNILLDCNDELHGGNLLIEECQRLSNSNENVFLINKMHQYRGEDVIKFSDILLFKHKSGIRYKNSQIDNQLTDNSVSSGIVIYQDISTQDDVGDDVGDERLKLDKLILLNQLKNNKSNDTQTLFNLAKILNCLGEYNQSYLFYQKRASISVRGLKEERYESYFRSAIISLDRLNQIDIAVSNFFNALCLDLRIEPLLILTEIYKNRNSYLLAYAFISLACEIQQDSCYKWELMATICAKIGKFSEGKHAYENFIKNKGVNTNLDKVYQNDIPEDLKVFEYSNEILPEILNVFNENLDYGRKNIENSEVAIYKLLQAFELTNYINPLVVLANHFRIKDQPKISWMFCNLACFSASKKDIDYDYFRWHNMGIVAYYNGKYRQGKNACLRAFKQRYGYSSERDKQNLQFYIAKLEDGINTDYMDFVNNRTSEIIRNNPKISKFQAKARAQLEWKYT